MADSLHEAMGPAIVRKLWNLQKPTIAAVNGAAYGLGCGLALSCDIRIASEAARFSEAFVRNGLIPADGSAWQLPRLIGMSNTLLLQYTGDAVDGQGVPHGAVQQSRAACGPDGHHHGAGDAAGSGTDLCHVPD